jgi:replication-associated recombination protein RarA
MAFNGRYDPHTLDDLVIDPHNRRVLEMMVSGQLRDHLLLEGTNGTAKSTIASILPRLKHGEDYEVEHVKAFPGFALDQALLDKWVNMYSWNRINGNAFYLVIDEIDTIDKNHSLFWQWLDQWRDRIAVIGTTNKLMAVPRAMRSRMKCLTFRPVKAIDMLPRARVIMRGEGVEINDTALLSELVAIEALGDIRKYMERLEVMAFDLRSSIAVAPAMVARPPRPSIQLVK